MAEAEWARAANRLLEKVCFYYSCVLLCVSVKTKEGWGGGGLVAGRPPLVKHYLFVIKSVIVVFSWVLSDNRWEMKLN